MLGFALQIESVWQYQLVVTSGRHLWSNQSPICPALAAPTGIAFTVLADDLCYDAGKEATFLWPKLDFVTSPGYLDVHPRARETAGGLPAADRALIAWSPPWRCRL